MLKFYKVMSVPIIMYGSETWVMNKKEKQKVQSAEMRFLRKVANYSLEDRKRNTEIRQELNIKELNSEIEHYRHKWTDHLDRMSNNRIPQIIYKYKPDGNRNVGRPRSRWKDQINRRVT